MNPVLKRTLTGLAFSLTMLSAIFLSHWTFLALFLFIHFFCLKEYITLLYPGRNLPFASYLVFPTGIALSLSCFFIHFSMTASLSLLITAIVLFALMLIIEVFGDNSNVFHNILYSLSALCFISLPLSMVFLLMNYQNKFSPYILVIAIGFTWINDTFAYFSGLLFGKHKLFPYLSPNKTWEGMVGGIIFTLLSSLLIKYLPLEIGLGDLHWMGAALLVSVVAVVGDAVESSFKRSVNVKDSGIFFPGHGGFLDRFDSLLAVIPFYLLYLIFIIG